MLKQSHPLPYLPRPCSPYCIGGLTAMVLHLILPWEATEEELTVHHGEQPMVHKASTTSLFLDNDKSVDAKLHMQLAADAAAGDDAAKPPKQVDMA